jgi:hypothetical protein
VAAVANFAPEFTVVGPVNVSALLSVSPFVLAKTKVWFATVENVPEFEIVWALVPSKLIVPALAGLKLSVAPVATDMLPLTECPGVAVIPRLNVTPVPIERLPLIISAEAPVPFPVQLPDVLSKLRLP